MKAKRTIMLHKNLPLLLVLVSILFMSSCQTTTQESPDVDVATLTELYDWSQTPSTPTQELLSKYTPFALTTDLSQLSGNQQKMVKILIEASSYMDELFWYDAYGSKEDFLTSIDGADQKAFAMINYGPWDRLNGNAAFIEGTPDKPAGLSLIHI